MLNQLPMLSRESSYAIMLLWLSVFLIFTFILSVFFLLYGQVHEIADRFPRAIAFLQGRQYILNAEAWTFFHSRAYFCYFTLQCIIRMYGFIYHVVAVSILTISLSFTFAKGDVSGFYTGTFVCNKVNVELTALVVQNFDNTVDMKLEAYSPNSNRTVQIGTWHLQGKHTSLFFSSFSLKKKNVLRRDLSYFDIINRLDVKRYSQAKLGSFIFSYNRKCPDLILVKNKKLSKKVIAEARLKREKDKQQMAQNPLSANLPNFKGYWHTTIPGKYKRKIHVNLMIAKDGSWLKTTEGTSVSYTPLIPAYGGPGTLTLVPANADNSAFEIDSVRLWISASTQLQSDVMMQLKSKSENTFKYARKIHQPIRLGKRMRRLSVKPDHFTKVFYGDWQDREHEGIFIVNDKENQNRLKKSIDQLYNMHGWKCLFQQSLIVPSNKMVTLNLREGISSSLYLIYAPFHTGQLVYGVSSPRNTAKIFKGSTFDFPVFQSAVPLRDDLSISFEVHPDTANPEVAYPGNGFPVTIFGFGNSFGDQGTGCEYYATQQIAKLQWRLQLVSQLLFIYLAERGRQASKAQDQNFMASLFNKGRDWGILETLKTNFQGKSEDELKFYSDLISLVMSNKFSIEGYTEKKIKQIIEAYIDKHSKGNEMDKFIRGVIVDFTYEKAKRDLLKNK